MLVTGIPELKSEDDISYMRSAFQLDKTDAEAAEHFKKQIHGSLNTKTTLANDVIHVLAHPK